MLLTSGIISVAPASIIITIVNVLVLLFIIKLLLFKPVNDILDKRQAGIAEEKNKAIQEREAAASLKKDYESRLSNIDELKKAAAKEAEEKGAREYDRLVGEAQIKAEELMESANAKIEMQKRTVNAEMAKKMADIVATATAKVSVQEENWELDSNLYDRFLDKVGENRAKTHDQEVASGNREA